MPQLLPNRRSLSAHRLDFSELVVTERNYTRYYNHNFDVNQSSNKCGSPKPLEPCQHHRLGHEPVVKADYGIMAVEVEAHLLPQRKALDARSHLLGPGKIYPVARFWRAVQDAACP